MGSRFLAELTVADLVTLSNAVIGFIAIAVAPSDPDLAARLILLSAVTDGVDGALARAFGGSEVGPYLDSLADVPSFALAPAVTLYVVTAGYAPSGFDEPLSLIIVGLIPALFVTLAILRLGVYSAYDTKATKTVGAPTTLVATILATAILIPHPTEPLLLGLTGILALAMITPVDYPDLLVRDALLMGAIHILAVAFPLFFGRVFVYALLTLAVAYLLLGPWFYWGETERRLRSPTKEKM